MPWLINPTQLENFRKNQKSLIIFDASLHLEDAGRHAKQEYNEKHIIGANFFDIDMFSDPDTEVPHMLLLDEKKLSEKLSTLGVRNDFKIIFYDNSDLHSACRALWMFKVFGHNPHLLYILDGGLAAYERFGGKLESGEPFISNKPYQVKLDLQWLRQMKDIKANLKNPESQVIDMRHGVRFAGGKEKRTGMRSGHIPNSFSFPYTTMFDAEKCFKPVEKIRQQFESIGVSFAHPMMTTCGAAITAPIFNFVLDLLGHQNHAVYDGSWSEWGAEKIYPGETSIEERPIENCLKENC